MKLKALLLLSVPFLALTGDTKAEFSGDPGLGGPITWCQYYHTASTAPWLPTDHYASRVVFSNTCPDIHPAPGHEIIGPLPESDPRFIPGKRQKIDTHDCLITIDSGPAV